MDTHACVGFYSLLGRRAWRTPAAQLISGPSKRSDDGFLNVLKSSDVSPRPHFFDIRISIAQIPINQSLLDMAPATHAPMVPIVNITRRGHATSPPDLAVAA